MSVERGLPGAYGALLEASEDPAGGLLEFSWAVLEASWTPKGRPKEAREVPKWSPGGVLNGRWLNLPKPRNLKDVFANFAVFDISRGPFGSPRRYKMKSRGL